MFAKYFVTCSVDVALKKAGFDEPCMAVHEYYTFEGQQYHKLIISYNNQIPDPTIYVESIRQIINERPGLFMLNNQLQKNSQLQPWLYAAPLYQQVFDWLEERGLYLHDYRIGQKTVAKFSDVALWGTMVQDLENNQLWPKYIGTDSEETRKYYHRDKRDAWDQAIMAALQILLKTHI